MPSDKHHSKGGSHHRRSSDSHHRRKSESQHRKSEVDILPPLKEVSKGEFIITNKTKDLNRPNPPPSPPSRYQVIEPMAPPPVDLTQRQGTPGREDRVSFAIERTDPDRRAGPDNLYVRLSSESIYDNPLNERLARTAHLSIDQFEQIVDEVWRQTGTNLYKTAARSEAYARAEAELARKSRPLQAEGVANALLPNDHSDYLRNRPDDPLGYAISSYMDETMRHFAPIETVDDLVDFYVNGRNPNIEKHKEEKDWLRIANQGSSQHQPPPGFHRLVRPKTGTDNICLTCRAETHVPNWCECCKERNLQNAEKAKELPAIPAPFDTFHVCGPDNKDCGKICKVMAKTRGYYAYARLVGQDDYSVGDDEELRSQDDWYRRYKQSMSNLGNRIERVENEVRYFREQNLPTK